MRCNVDVQDLRRTLPPRIWMPSEDLEPETTEDQEKYPYMHGAYPQRLKDFSLGPQIDWGYFQHLNTTAKASSDFGVYQTWPERSVALAQLREVIDDDELEDLIKRVLTGRPHGLHRQPQRGVLHQLIHDEA